MSNEILFLLAALVDIIFVLIASWQGTEWLLGTVILNLLLVGIFGAKLVSIFGFVTNAGNVFYACVFLATHFILELRGRKAALRTIWVGVVFVFFFSALSQFAVMFNGSGLSQMANASLAGVFSFSFRVFCASILAYIFAQYVNISLYEWLRDRMDGKHLWIRSNGANILAQLVDSCLFFSIAFFDLPGPLLVQAILIGWAVKTAVVLLGTPFLYLGTSKKP